MHKKFSLGSELMKLTLNYSADVKLMVCVIARVNIFLIF